MSETKISAILTVEGLRGFQSDMNTAATAVDRTADRGVIAGRAMKTAMRAGFLAAGAAAVVSVKNFASFDDAMNRVKINSGASAKQMVTLEKAARKMGKQFPASSVEVADAMNEILKAGMSVEDMLSGGLENALSVATAEGMDMATAANVMSNAMVTFGVSGKNANVVAAALSNTASATSADVNDLALSLGQVGGTANQAGWGIGETTAALGVLIQHGLTGSKAGTSLNNMLSRMMSASGDSAKAMKKLGIEVYDSKGKMKDADAILDSLSKAMSNNMTEAERNGLLMKAFGIDGKDAAVNLGTARAEVEKLTKANANLDAPVQKAHDQMKSLGMQLDTTRESLGNMAIQIGGALAPAISTALPYVQSMAAAIGENSDQFISGASSAVALASSVAGVLSPALDAAQWAMSGLSDKSSDAGMSLAAIAGGAATSAAGVAILAASVMKTVAAIKLMTLAARANPVIAVAVVGAAAIGATVAAIDQIGDSAQKSRNYVLELGSAMSVLEKSGKGVEAKTLAWKIATNELALAKENVTRVSKTEGATAAQITQAKLSEEQASIRQTKASQDLRKAKDKEKDAQEKAKSATVEAYKNSEKYQAQMKELVDIYKAGSIDSYQFQKGVDALSEAFGGVPENTKADIDTNAPAATKKIDGVTGAIHDVPPSKTVTIRAETSGFSSAMSMVQRTLANIRSKTVTVGGKKGDGMASGGRVYGPGTGTSDSVPAMLSAGEWVLTAKQAKAIGYGQLANLPKFAKGGGWFNSQAQAARASMQSGSSYWKAQQRAGATSGLVDDRKVANQQVAALKKRLASIKKQSPSGKGDALKANKEARSGAIRELNDMIRELQAQSWQITKIGIPGARADAAEAAAGKQQADRQSAAAAVGAAGSALWQQAQMAGSTDSLDDDLAALRARVTALQGLGTTEAAERIADTESEIWTLLNVTAPAQQRAAVQSAINAVGAKGSDLWKRSSIAATTDTLTDDLSVLQERLAALQAFGPEASQQIADAEADIWTMLNITMPQQAAQQQAQVDGWKNEAAMALGRGFYGASGGAGGGSGMGITDSSGGDAGGVGHAPRPEIDRIWLAGEQLNDLDARTGNGVEIVEILGWDEAEDFESTRSKRADGDALGGTRDGSVKLVVRGRLTGSTYQDYHERRRALKAKVRAAVDETLLKVPDVTLGDEAGDYPDTYATSGMAGMERRRVRLTANVKWGDAYGLYGSEFEFELRSPQRFVESDVTAEAPSGSNAAAMSASTAARTSILAIRGEVAAAPAMDSALKFAGTSAASEIAVRAASTGAALDTFTKLTNPASLPAGSGIGAAFSPGGTYLAIATSSSPYIVIYKRSGDTFTKLTDPASLPAGAGVGAAFSADGTYLAVATSSSPYITIYKRSGDTFTKLTNPASLPAGAGEMPSFSPDGTYLAVPHATSPYITIYKRSADTFTKLADPASLPAGNATGSSFDPTGTYLAVAVSASPYIVIYKRSGDTFTKLADPSSLPAGSAGGAAFSPDGTYLAVAHVTSPYITIYKRSGDTFTKLANPASLPAGAGDNPCFDPSGSYLSVAHASSPRVTIYKRSGDTFTKLADPASLPAGNANSNAFSPDGAYLAVAHATSPYVTIYAVSGSDSGFAPLGTLHASPPSLAISSRTDTLPVASADISSSQPLTSQDSFDIDTIAGTATPVHRTPLARLIGGSSFIAGIIPSRYAGGPTTMLEIVTRSAAAGAAVAALAAFAQSDTDVVNSVAAGEDDFIGLLGALTASPAQVATGMPGWRAKRSAANFTASSYARRRIDAKLGEPKSRPMIHTMLVKPAASWATATTDLNAFGSGLTKFAHLLTLEIKNVSSTNYVNAVGFYHDGTRLTPTCVRYDDKATDGYQFTYLSGALSITPDPAAHVWVAAILDAGTSIWNAIILVDVNTGEPLMWVVYGSDMFDKAASAGSGTNGSASITGTGSGTRAGNVAYPTAAERYIGCGSDTAGWAASVAGTTVPAGGMGAIVTLDAADELFDYGITNASMLTGASTTANYNAVAAAIVDWVRGRFAPQSIRRQPIALEVEWADRVPDLHGEPIIRLDSVANTTTEQSLGASRTGGLSTEQMVTAAAGGAGEAVIEAREVR